MQILLFLLILTVVVLVHEWGHFAAARFFKIKVEEFGIGFPPRMLRLFKRGETEYTINWLPIGGFVKIYGENGEGQEVKDERAFWSKPVWQRAVVLVAGVAMNLVLAVVLFGTVYSILGVPAMIDGVRVLEVSEGSPAQTAGLEEGVIVTSLVTNEGELVIKGSEGFVEKLRENLGEEVVLKIKEGEEVLEKKVTLRSDPGPNEGALGAVVTDTELTKYPWYQMPFRGVWVGFQEAFAWGREIVVGLGGMVYQLVTGQGLPKDIAGPVGIYQISNQAREAGWMAVLQFVGILSVNLMILNLLPFPGLDGGRLLFLGIELVRGRKLREDVEGWINMAGMMLLLGLMVVITFNDVVRITGGWLGIQEKLQSWF